MQHNQSWPRELRLFRTGSTVPEAGLVLGLLAAVAFLAAIGRRVGLPDPIVFALGALPSR